MHGNADDIADPSRSGQDDSPSAFLHGSKLWKRLEKLAQWRIDPSLIEFPPDALEFRGGFATVSRGLLSSSSGATGGVNESEHATDEAPSLDNGDPQSSNDTQEPGPKARGKDEEAEGHGADGGNDKTKGGGLKEQNSEEEHNSPRRTSVLKIGSEASLSRHTGDESPGPGDHDYRSHSDTKEDEVDKQDDDEGSAGGIADRNNDEAKGQLGKEYKGSPEMRNGPSSKQSVAVKKLKIETETDLKRVLGLALRESEFLTELSHPNIVQFEGFVEDLPVHKVWLIFRWEEHGNLRDLLASGEWEIPERISLINDVALGLEYLHNQEPPIYHGDLKSLNILVDSECHALITDFGSARHLEREQPGQQLKENEGPDKPRLKASASDPAIADEHITLEAFFSATASTITLTGSSYTLRWAAPELLQDDNPCLRSDVWALGWIAYEVMTNTIPFHDIKKDAIVINRVIQGHLPSITEDARMSLIRALCSLMVRCWSINPDKRPTAEECRKFISWMPMIVPAPAQAMAEEASQLRHARLLNKLGNMYEEQADYVSALSSFTAALDIYTSHNNLKGRGETLRYLAGVHRFRNELNEAVKFYLEAMQILTKLGDETERGGALFGLALTHIRRYDYGEAARLYEECLQIYTDTGNERQRASALWGLAEVHRFQAEYREAIDLYSEARQIYTKVGDRRERAITLCGLATVHRAQGEYNEAVNLYSEALQTYTDVGDHRETASALYNLAMVHLLQSRYSEARKLHSESLQIFIRIEDRHGKGTALYGLAEVHSALHEYDKATRLYSEALQIFTDIGNKHWRADTLMSYAETTHRQGHLREAASLYTEASAALEEIGESSSASRALGSATEIHKTLERATADSAETIIVGEEPF